MDRQDFWTHLIIAALTVLATLPALLAPWQGPRDTYKVLFLLGPLAMVGIAWWGRRQSRA